MKDGVASSVGKKRNLIFVPCTYFFPRSSSTCLSIHLEKESSVVKGTHWNLQAQRLGGWVDGLMQILSQSGLRGEFQFSLCYKRATRALVPNCQQMLSVHTWLKPESCTVKFHVADKRLCLTQVTQQSAVGPEATQVSVHHLCNLFLRRILFLRLFCGGRKATAEQ